MRRRAIIAVEIAGRALALAACGACAACGARARSAEPGPDLQIVGEGTVIRGGDPAPATSPWFDGATVRLFAARGETLGVQVLHRGGAAGVVTLVLGGAARVTGFDVAAAHVARPSTELYGGSRGAGDYPNALVHVAADAPVSDPAYFEIAVAADAKPGVTRGELVAGARRVPVELTVSTATLGALPVEGVWAYADPRELAWAGLPASALEAPSASERACIAVFRAYGVLLSPDLPLAAWPARRELLAGARDVPVRISDDPATAGSDARAWVDALRGPRGDQVPFAIPIDEPHGAAARARVAALADAVHAAAGSDFVVAVTAAPGDDLRGHVDRFISPDAAHLTGDRDARWTYNGKPPAAAALVIDGAEPGLRTWGWIGWRYHIPTWYVWDALYWHDRHDRHGAPLPGRALAAARDAVSFDDGEDRGNLDGVLAMPGTAAAPCVPTLRLAQLRRGLQDRALLDAASACDPDATNLLAARLIPRALGDAHGDAAWPASDAAFEAARREALLLAAGCANRLPR